MDRPFLPVNLKWLKSKHYLHHYHSLLHHQGSVHHSWWLCRYDNFAIVFFYVWFNVIPEKQVNSHFCITVEYHFSNTLRKRSWFRLKKKCGVVSSLLFFITWRGVTCAMQVTRQLDTRIEMRVSFSSP